MNTQSATTSPNKDKFSKVYYQTKSIFQYLSQPNVGGFWEQNFWLSKFSRPVVERRYAIESMLSTTRTLSTHWWWAIRCSFPDLDANDHQDSWFRRQMEANWRNQSIECCFESKFRSYYSFYSRSYSVGRNATRIMPGKMQRNEKNRNATTNTRWTYLFDSFRLQRTRE